MDKTKECVDEFGYNVWITRHFYTQAPFSVLIFKVYPQPKAIFHSLSTRYPQAIGQSKVHKEKTGVYKVYKEEL